MIKLMPNTEEPKLRNISNYRNDFFKKKLFIRQWRITLTP